MFSSYPVVHDSAALYCPSLRKKKEYKGMKRDCDARMRRVSDKQVKNIQSTLQFTISKEQVEFFWENWKVEVGKVRYVLCES